MDNNRQEDNTSFLTKNGIDLTLKAANGELNPVYNRDEEIKKLEEILLKKNKNNPLIIGEPGVGKTAIVEGLAQKIYEKNVSDKLLNKRIIQLDLTTVVAGTLYRGQFEDRIKNIIAEVKADKNIILFIDEIHTMLSAGSSEDGLNTANSFKPALSRGEITLIGATTIKEFRKTIEKDGALNRRFEKVMVEEPSKEETRQIIESIKPIYENFHNVVYSQEAIDNCIELSDRYLNDKNFPDKAIDLLDKSATNVIINKDLKEIQDKIASLVQEKNNAVRKQDFLLAASLYEEQKKLMDDLIIKKEENVNSEKRIISKEDVCRVVSEITSIPIDNLSQNKNDKILNIDKNVRKIVIGQDKAIDKIIKTLQRSQLGLRDIKKPIGTFLFVGQSGVGKTYLSKVLAKEMYNNDKSYIKIDMSEYSEKINISRLIGSAPGYVGYDDAGVLTEKVKRHPYSCVVFDEIEKAHPYVLNLLLQIMDDGCLTNNYGEKIDFKNTIIILTSNLGTSMITDNHAIGYGSTDNTKDSTYLKEIKKKLSVEFLNRLDDIIIFNELNKEDIKNIIKIEMDDLQAKLNKIGYSYELSDELLDTISDKEYNTKYGAREIKRYIQSNIEDALCEYIINNNPPKDSILIIDNDKDKYTISIKE